MAKPGKGRILDKRSIALIIGVTGGVGAGKSTVLQTLEGQGIPCLRTDDMAKGLYQKGSQIYAALIQLFGEEILGEGGSIDLGRMAACMYQDREKREAVDGLVHPAVWQLVREQSARLLHEADCVCVETALPAQDFYSLCDEIWYVHTDREIRIQRLMSDRKYTREKAEAIIASQPTEEDYRRMADFVIDNSLSKEETIHEIYEHCQWKQR